MLRQGLAALARGAAVARSSGGAALCATQLRHTGTSAYKSETQQCSRGALWVAAAGIAAAAAPTSVACAAPGKEQSFVMVKPDGVNRALVAEIIHRFEMRGYKLVAIKVLCEAEMMPREITRWLHSQLLASSGSCRRQSCSSMHHCLLLKASLEHFEDKPGHSIFHVQLLVPPKDLVQRHYGEHAGKFFFDGLVNFLSSGAIVAMVWEGDNIVRIGRTMLGVTDPQVSQPGTLRGDLGISRGRNLVHASDSVESAQKEIALWFKPDEIAEYERPLDAWI